MRKIKERCLSRKDYLKKDNSNVGYALYVQDNIRKDDYVRLNTGEIVKVIGVKENNVNMKAIYYGFYDTDWFDSSAVENFSENIIDLIKEKDILKYKLNNLSSYKIAEVRKYKDARSFKEYLGVEGFGLEQIKILDVLTKEQYSQNCYKVVGGEDEL